MKKINFLIISFFILFTGIIANAQVSPGGVSGFAAWYKSDAGLTSTSWADQSANSYNLTGQNAPVVTNLVNFNPVATFNGSNQRYASVTTAKASWPVGTTATTYYYVAKNTAAVGNNLALGIGASGVNTGFHSGEVATTGFIASAGATALTTGAATATVATSPTWNVADSNAGLNLVRTGYDGGGSTGKNYISSPRLEWNIAMPIM